MTAPVKTKFGPKQCRTCAKDEAIVPIFAQDDTKTTIHRIIEDYLPTKVTKDDGLPPLVCEMCVTALSSWNDFYTGFISADAELKEILKNQAEAEAEEDEAPLDLPDFSDGGSDSDHLPLRIANPVKKKKVKTKKETKSSKTRDNLRDARECSARKQSATIKKNIETCAICLKVVRTLDAHLTKHEVCRVATVRFCVICGQEMVNVEQLSSHLYTHMDLENTTESLSPNQCQQCQEEFPALYHLTRHQVAHLQGIGRGNTKKTVHCVVCGKAVMRMTLLRHLSIHSGEKRYTCDQCGKQYAQESGLVRHVRISHEGVRRYKCPICSAILRSNSELRSHQATHPDPKPFQCDECGRTFPSQKHLYHHHKYHHTENGLRVECQQCDRVFSSASVLRRHHKVVHLRLREFQCDVCSAKLSTKQYLQDHMRTHSDERPEVCAVCGKTFQMAGNLRQHMKTHMERSQVCEICGKRFARRCQLVIHMGSHRGFSSPQCDQCGQTFLLKTDLQNFKCSE